MYIISRNNWILINPITILELIQVVQVDYWRQHTVCKVLSFKVLSLWWILAMPLSNHRMLETFSRSLRFLCILCHNCCYDDSLSSCKVFSSLPDTSTHCLRKYRMIQLCGGEFKICTCEPHIYSAPPCFTVILQQPDIECQSSLCIGKCWEKAAYPAQAGWHKTSLFSCKKNEFFCDMA